MFQVQQLLKPSATKHPESLKVLVDVGSFTDEDMAYLPRRLEADSDLRKLDVALREQRIKGEPGKAMQVFRLLRTLQWVPAWPCHLQGCP